MYETEQIRVRFRSLASPTGGVSKKELRWEIHSWSLTFLLWCIEGDTECFCLWSDFDFMTTVVVWMMAGDDLLLYCGDGCYCYSFLHVKMMMMLLCHASCHHALLSSAVYHLRRIPQEFMNIFNPTWFSMGGFGFFSVCQASAVLTFLRKHHMDILSLSREKKRRE